MEKSESIKNIAGALFVFHQEVGGIKKNSKNPFFKSNYANLGDIQDAIEEPLEKAGITYAQFPIGENGLYTILIHKESGEYMGAEYKMTPSKNDPQGQGSALTYQRRYALCGVLGLKTEDDDGNSASMPKNAKTSDLEPFVGDGSEFNQDAPTGFNKFKRQ